MPLLTTGAGRAAGGGASYAGPGDVQGSATSFWGLRAYNAAYAAPGTNPCIDITDGTNNATIAILTNGFADWTSIASFITAHGSASVKKIYDQVGTNHLTQATLSAMPTLVSAFTSKYALKFVQASSQQIADLSMTAISQPVSVSAFFNSNAAGTAGSICGDNGNFAISVNRTANTIGTWTGGGWTSIACTNNGSTWHAVNTIYNSASSNMNLDGTDNTFSSTISQNGISVGRDNGNGFGFDGQMTEIGVWASAIGTPASLSTNQHAAWA